MTRIDLDVQRDLPTPLIKQVRDGLRAKITGGLWPAGRRIPSERELAESLGLSRLTVRLALNDLVAEGLLQREQGKGTFVKQPAMEQALGRFYSFTEEMSKKGMRPRSIVKDFQADVEAAGEFPGRAHCLTRLRLADDEPIMFETTRLDAALCPGLTRAMLETSPLYDLLRRHYGLRFGRARESFEPVLLDGETAGQLGAEAGAPALLLLRELYDERGAKIESTRSIVRGDRCRYVMEWTHTWE